MIIIIYHKHDFPLPNISISYTTGREYRRE